MRHALLFGMAGLVMGVFWGQAEGEIKPGDRPNVVVILADDLGYGDLGVYNPDSKIPTPHLDRLAAAGMRFTDAHASDAVCTPSRYSLLTGRYAFRSRLKSGVLPPWGAPLIEEGRLTVASLLRQQGYTTACFGKWHLGWAWPTRDGRAPSSVDGVGNVDFGRPLGGGPLACGFETYFGVDLPNYPPYCFIEGNRTVGQPSVAAPMQVGGYNRPGPVVAGWNLTNILPEITGRVVRYLEDPARVQQPFLLYFPLTAPHYPVVPAEEFRGRSRAGIYGDFVTQVDGVVGQVMGALDRAGLAGNTLVIFSSDNGPEVVEIDPGAYQRVRLHGHRSMGDLRGTKRDAWEGGHRVPFIARWPGRIAAGAVSGETICQVDLLATLAGVVGAKLPADAGEDSYDISPVLFGRGLDRPIREATVLHSASGKFVIRQGEWVLIDARSGEDNGKGGEPEWYKAERGYVTHTNTVELYNLREDSAQRRNRCEGEEDRVQQMRGLLESYKSKGRSVPQRQ
jgi:arylsulfatase A-like enzyme